MKVAVLLKWKKLLLICCFKVQFPYVVAEHKMLHALQSRTDKSESFYEKCYVAVQ